MPFWAWILLGLAAVLLVIIVVTIKCYPQDNSF
ncbi:hypothetical protein Pla86_25920 [Planctomycetes bacterium Pla86]|uniref:Uncharacterized protein n=1 Tax=Engelhardtia mirabilis TaxID=2528011 RepID=A0A518BKK4_9BACT|nr:hypothetical protein Pla133_25930 [Planctomycetes bacterium Pla133]QDV01834.1 hypothetical protein Pla86_25920 [Planctomycetes bacterium Pla86]